MMSSLLFLLVSISFSLEIDNGKVKGSIIYNRTANSTGWNFLRINLESVENDEDVFATAGRYEGEESREEIYNAYMNYIYGIQGGRHFLPKSLQIYVHNQYNWLKEQSQSQNTPYWRMVKYLLIQLENMYEGYNYHYGKTEKALSFDQFYYLSNMGDLQDLWPSVGQVQTQGIGNCNSFYKPGIVAHSTFNVYQTMLRIYKSYNFKLKDKDVVNPHLSFTARPGDLESKDDFFVLWDTQMVVTETSFNNYNKENYAYFHYDSVPCWMRVNIASRLAKTPQEWTDIFGLHRSGTHNNQWVVTDYNKIFMGEEAFFHYKVHDLTNTLLASQGYVASYNVPLDQEIFDSLKYPKTTSYNDDVRARQFRIYQGNLKTVKEVGKLVRYNKVTAEFDACDGALSPRCDLGNGYTFGGIDGKVISQDMIKNKKVHLISSPSYQNHDPFNWKAYPNIPHYGMTDEWRFPWYEIDETNFTIKELYLDY
ncbi:unnamed protein product [Paramecium octaurelia]|uniref:Phospholipase B-like n=1 Tax=Paramecium octaurelia TaxID=43137 RepID=A0A8S1VZ71_PAROT|nr:unnamed protein product [Paramecium octaurelia]